jgi:hypothetical protein
MSKTCWKPAADVITQQMKEEIVLLNLKSNLFYELNHTAARLWQLLSEGHSIDAIKQQLLQEFEVEPDQLDHEIGDLLAMLEAEGLVTSHEPR